MQHPTIEEWALYAGNEVTREAEEALAAHLRGCAICAASLASLRRTAERLSVWDHSPESSNRTVRPWLGGMVKWSIAAGIVLGTGFAVGRFATPVPENVAAIRSQMEASLKSALHAEMRDKTALALAGIEERMNRRTDEQITRVMENIIPALQTATNEDRDATRALVEEMREQHEKDVRWLRADLETLASHADDEIRLAHFRLRQLTARGEMADSK